MKRLLTIWILAGFILPASAQEQTLLSGPLEHGGYGGPSLKVAEIYGSKALMMGGVGGWIINHTFVLGGGGYGLVSEISAPQIIQPPAEEDRELYIDMGYGGVYFQYISKSEKMLHYTISTLVGAGGITYSDHRSSTDENYIVEESEAFFVAEPGFEVELNVTTNFRINTGVSYLYISGVNNMTGLTSDDLSGPTFQVTLKFGKF